MRSVDRVCVCNAVNNDRVQHPLLSSQPCTCWGGRRTTDKAPCRYRDRKYRILLLFQPGNNNHLETLYLFCCFQQESYLKPTVRPTCNMSSGVEIIPPQRVTRARVRELDHRTTSSRSISSASARIVGFDTRIARIKSLITYSHLYYKCSLNQGGNLAYIKIINHKCTYLNQNK